MQLASERLNIFTFLMKKLKGGRVRHKLSWEDNTVMHILGEAEFELTDGTRNNVLYRRILEKM